MGFNSFAGRFRSPRQAQSPPSPPVGEICMTCIKLFRVVLMCSEKVKPR